MIPTCGIGSSLSSGQFGSFIFLVSWPPGVQLTEVTLITCLECSRWSGAQQIAAAIKGRLIALKWGLTGRNVHRTKKKTPVISPCHFFSLTNALLQMRYTTDAGIKYSLVHCLPDDVNEVCFEDEAHDDDDASVHSHLVSISALQHDKREAHQRELQRRDLSSR